TVKETKKEPVSAEETRFSWKDLNQPFKIFILASLIFSLGNSSDAFLILRAKNLGLSLTLTIFAYVLFNVTYALFSEPAGAVADRLGPKKVLITGFVLFAVVYVLFGLVTSSVYMWILFPLYGIYMGLTDGVGKAYISTMVPKEKLGTAFGIYYTITGICVLLSSTIAGLLWTYVSVSAPFIYGGVMAIIATVIFIPNYLSKKG
ncbi:MAG TPA: MFS transporter, partial [Chitinispirillaceae bacterium]|nr:MFS transporter [Chitinispirillaceae bacterium]